MPFRRTAVVLAVAAGFALTGAPQLPLEPQHDSGQSITGAFEGWFPNPDGTFSILIGYYNRNLKQEIDIPIGPENRIEPGGPDRGQPTHFLPARQWGVFTITVPKEFGTGRLTWTLVAHQKPTVIPVNLDPLWELSPFADASGNTPPSIAFEENGKMVQGPRGIAASMTAALSGPLNLTLWVADDARPPGVGARPRGSAVTVSWSKFRGPGKVTFQNDKPSVDQSNGKEAAFTGKAATAVTFSEPGDYVLRVVANDWSGDGGRGFQCCWTNGQVKVSVRP